MKWLGGLAGLLFGLMLGRLEAAFTWMLLGPGRGRSGFVGAVLVLALMAWRLVGQIDKRG